MIDIDFSKIEEQKLGGLPLLILEDSHADCYCTINKDYARILQQIHSPTFNLNYQTLYRQLGPRGFKKYLTEFIKKNDIRILYFRDLSSAELDLNFIEDLRTTCFIFTYFGDILEHFNTNYRYWAQVVDVIFVDDYYDKFPFSVYGKEGLFLPPAFDSRVYVPQEIKNKKYDVSFVGRMDRVGRKEFIAFLKRHGIAIEVFGWGSPNGVVDKKEMIAIFNNSKINLNFTGISEIFKNRVESRVKQLKGHCQEIALTKSFVLTEDSPGIHRMFAIGSEVDTFHDENDLLRKIQFYLKNDGQRKEMAEKAYHRAIQEYEIVRVWERILQLVYFRAKNKEYRAMAVVSDGQFRNAVCLGRSRYFLSFTWQGKFRFAWEELSEGVKSGSLFLVPVVIINLMVAVLGKIGRRIIKIAGSGRINDR